MGTNFKIRYKEHIHDIKHKENSFKSAKRFTYSAYTIKLKRLNILKVMSKGVQWIYENNILHGNDSNKSKLHIQRN